MRFCAILWALTVGVRNKHRRSVFLEHCVNSENDIFHQDAETKCNKNFIHFFLVYNKKKFSKNKKKNIENKTKKRIWTKRQITEWCHSQLFRMTFCVSLKMQWDDANCLKVIYISIIIVIILYHSYSNHLSAGVARKRWMVSWQDSFM